MMTATVKDIITRGQVWLADLGKPMGSEQGWKRPVLVVSNDKNNIHSTTLTIVPLTSKTNKNKIPTHVSMEEAYLSEVSIALVEQVRVIDKVRLIEKMGVADPKIMVEIDEAIKVQTALKQKINHTTAFGMIKQIYDIKLEIKELGKRPRLMSMYQNQVSTFKNYCQDCNVDYKSILDEYNQRRIANAL